MIRYVHKNNGKVLAEEAPEHSAKQWVQVVNPSELEIEKIAAEHNVDAGLLRDSTDIDEMPRFDSDDNNSYLFARFAHRASSGHIQTLPILFVVTESSLITVSPKHFDDLEDLLEKQTHLTTNSPKHLLLPMLNKCLQSYAIHLATIGRQIRTARNSLRDEKFSNRHFVKFVEIEDILNDFLSELVPINNIMLHLLAGRKLIKFADADYSTLQDLQLENAQLIDETKGYLKTIVNIREAYSNIMTNNLNRQIKILTTLTIVLTVPTIVGSFFGMNVPLPLQHNQVAFFIIFGVTFAVAFAILAFLKKKDWL
jgi:magnesium transporter